MLKAIYIYIYIYKEREREREREKTHMLSKNGIPTHLYACAIAATTY